MSAYEKLLRLQQKPLSEVKRQFPCWHPDPECRTFNLPSLEKLIKRIKGIISDPEYFWLFEISYPITLDTMVKWRDYATATDPITKNKLLQMRNLRISVRATSMLCGRATRPHRSTLIFRSLKLRQTHIRLRVFGWQSSICTLTISSSRPTVIVSSPHLNRGIPPSQNSAYSQNNPKSAYDHVKVFDCKWELDSLHLSSKFRQHATNAPMTSPFRNIIGFQ